MLIADFRSFLWTRDLNCAHLADMTDLSAIDSGMSVGEGLLTGYRHNKLCIVKVDAKFRGGLVWINVFHLQLIVEIAMLCVNFRLLRPFRYLCVIMEP